MYIIDVIYNLIDALIISMDRTRKQFKWIPSEQPAEAGRLKSHISVVTDFWKQ